MGLNSYLKDLSREHDGRPLLCWASKTKGAELNFAAFMGTNAIRANIPTPIDLRDKLPPVFDQKTRGCCVPEGNVGGMKAYQEILQGDYPINGLSISYNYVCSKGIDGFPDGEGTTPLASMTALQTRGVCPEEIMPTSLLLDLPEPQLPKIPAGADEAAARFKIASPAQICSRYDTDRSQLLTVIRTALATRGVFTMALLVAENFTPDANNILPLPGGTIRGGHQIAIVGDLPDLKVLIVRNSWGSGWGEKGYAYLPYEWLTKYIDMTGYGTKTWVVFESWTSVDIIAAPVACKEGNLWIGENYAEIDGNKVYLDQPPVINEATGRTLAPVRFAFENAGYTVEWFESEQRVHFYKPVA